MSRTRSCCEADLKDAPVSRGWNRWPLQKLIYYLDITSRQMVSYFFWLKVLDMIHMIEINIEDTACVIAVCSTPYNNCVLKYHVTGKPPKETQQHGRYTKETKTRLIHFSNNPGRMSTENVHNREEEDDEIGALDALNTLEKEASEYKKVLSPFPYRLTPSNPTTRTQKLTEFSKHFNSTRMYSSILPIFQNSSSSKIHTKNPRF